MNSSAKVAIIVYRVILLALLACIVTQLRSVAAVVHDDHLTVSGKVFVEDGNIRATINK